MQATQRVAQALTRNIGKVVIGKETAIELMLNAILRAFLSSGIVIVVILFQPEIRRVLEQVGSQRLKFLSIFSREDTVTEMEKTIITTKNILDSFPVMPTLKLATMNQAKTIRQATRIVCTVFRSIKSSRTVIKM